MEYLQLLFLGLAIHFVLLISIFDIYFHSPIVHGIPPQNNLVKTPADRVVVISVDGLRFDTLFERNETTNTLIASYIQNIATNKGSISLSLSHLPTESRPGHVAMLAGFYEDPSAVTRGWKENPVDFDSLFNRSDCSFSWGSPEILNIFLKDLKHNCVHGESYESEQNFAGNTMKLDDWVFDKAKEFFEYSKQKVSLRGNKTLFFLHLLGQDTSGHKDKPHTTNYIKHLKNVDNIVKGVESLFNNFFQDNKTSFVLTSDHGMTDWGSHGAGDPSETNTPLITWGAGLKKMDSVSKILTFDQADITPLIAVLLGVPIPVNSVGVLPVQLLDFPERDLSEALLLNVKQMGAQFQRKLQIVKEQSMSWLFKPYKHLTLKELPFKIVEVTNDIVHEKYELAQLKSRALIELSLEGLEYYHNYYQNFLFLFISATYVTWILYLILQLSEDERRSAPKSNVIPKICLSVAIIVTIALLLVQKLPLLFYFYSIIPQILLYNVIKKMNKLYMLVKKIQAGNSILILGIFVLGVEVLVASFFHRGVLSLSLGAIIIWSKFSNIFKTNNFTFILWGWSGLTLAFFTFLPVIGGSPKVSLLLISGLFLTLFSGVSSFYSVKNDGVLLPLARCLVVAAATWNSVTVHQYFNIRGGLPFFNQCFSWLLCACAFSIIFIQSKKYLQRLQSIFISLSVPFILLSVSYEGLFLLIFFVHLFCWVSVETTAEKMRSSSPEKLGLSDFRRAYIFLAYIWLAFFGMGNIASLNSFDPAWVRCFITVFSPFLMSFLILFKTVIPFLAVTCTIRTVAVTLNLQAYRLFLIVLIYCNIMGLNFLYLVQNKGSWLDIGTSISHYVIQQVAVVFLVLLYGLALLLIHNGSCPSNDHIPSFLKNSAKASPIKFFSRLKTHKS